MTHNLHIVAVILLSIMVLIPAYNLLADGDYIEARRLLESGEILPLETILKQVRLTHPGKILEVELEKEEGVIVYEVEILSENGRVSEVYINAITGQLLLEKEDD